MKENDPIHDAGFEMSLSAYDAAWEKMNEFQREWWRVLAYSNECNLLSCETCREKRLQVSAMVKDVSDYILACRLYLQDNRPSEKNHRILQ